MPGSSSTTSTLSGPIVPPGRFWAKLHPRENPSTYHPLLAHSADVAAVLQRLLQPDSPIAARLAHSAGLDVLSDAWVARLVYLAGLHDLGKVNHSFQNQWRPGAARSKGHVQVVLESLTYGPLQQIWLAILGQLSLPRSDAHELLRTTICHHGRPFDPAPNPIVPIWQDDARRKPLAEIRRLSDLAREWSGLDAAAATGGIALTPHFLHLFAGTLTLADWVGSTQSAFRFDPAAEHDPHAYWRTGRERAERACTAIGLTPRTTVCSLAGVPLLERLFPAVFGADRPEHLAYAQPTPLQKHVAEMELPAPGSRLLVESETGSGKTEAALALYARLRAAGRVGGLVFALPTRATARAMHTRVRAAVEVMYEPGARPTVALAMGGEQAQATLTDGPGEAELLTAEEPDTYPDPAERELVHWSSDSAKKFFAAEIVVGTLDQLLLGALAVKHAHLRLAAFSRHLLVIDELHSYDRYMSEVLQCALNATSAVGGVALLMSATLSDRERLRFGDLIASDDEDQTPYDESVGRPYPVVAVCAEPGRPWVDTELQPAGGPPKPPLIWRLCREEQGLARAVDAAAAGARVCVLRSTVKGARATVRALIDHGAQDLLWRPLGSEHAPAYHSRYTLPDREALDRGVLDAYGRGSAGGGGRILVATQVAEQSLDVDFDLMITDLCPVDVLLQRLGRVWRHRERDAVRPDDCRTVQSWIVEPDDGLESLLGNPRSGKNGWGTVYAHLGFLELTRRAIHGHPTVEVPKHNRALIESVYHSENLDRLRDSSPAWGKHFTDMDGETIGRELTARAVVIRFGDTYIGNADRFDRDIMGSVRTRLGDDRVRVRLPAPLAGFYATAECDSVDLPREKLLAAGISLDTLGDAAATGGLRNPEDLRSHYRLDGFEFSYGPQGWQW